MNETNNGSYYATDEEVKRAQCRYKTREIKKFLQKQGKKELQNAIVIELAKDLHDVGIQPDALFELGNLHDDIADENRC
jgi:predicted TIM-barrel fold metal-dependent hydrolase